ncbi:MAG TPA: SpoIIE family protein phosphatase [Patescibacteria group bacterium]|nr:SpoIIE family protein phosphatase [Patescibacteria group bacterium]
MGAPSAAEDGRTRILIVDDERMNRTLLQAALAHGGYATDSVEDGLAAWERLDASPTRFAVVLLDRRMPRMNGMELLARIRADDRLKYLPVIMQTAHSSSEEVVEGIRAGAYYYLAKPLNLQLLLSVVARAVEEHCLRRRFLDDLDQHTAALNLLDAGVFRFQTPEAGKTLAVALARCCPGSRNLVMGLSEVFANAVEHGNLGLSFDEKSRLLDDGSWSEEIARRLILPDYVRRWVTVEMQRLPGEIRFIVRDEGQGFDWRPYLDIDPARAYASHGRGIAMARRLSFDDMLYRGRGNEVVCTVRNAATASTSAEKCMPLSIRDRSDEMAAARAMQVNLLPSDSVLAAIEQATALSVSGLFQPAAEIGGDIWGVLPLDDHRVALYLADFSGHGVPAALHTFRLDAVIETMVKDRDQPARYLSQLNQQLTGMLSVGNYCAMLYGVVDTNTSLFTYAAAASMRPLVIDPSSHEVWQGDGRGLPLGIAKVAAYQERQLPLPPGALLFLYSDALPEARSSAGKPIGASAMPELLRQAVADGGSLEATSLVTAILAHSDDAPRILDDLTAVCCQRQSARSLAVAATPTSLAP